MYKQFLEDTTGAVTVDWVVLTAAVTGLGLATVSVVSAGLEDLATDIQQSLMSTNAATGSIDPWNSAHPTYVACQDTDVDFNAAVTLAQDAYDNNTQDPLFELDYYQTEMETALNDGSYVGDVAAREQHQCKIDVWGTVVDNNNLA